MDKILTEEIIEYLEKFLQVTKNDYAKLFCELNRSFKGMEVAYIYNYILLNKQDVNLLNQTIKEINSKKYIQNFDELLKFILIVQDVNLKALAIKTIATYKNTKAVPVWLQCLKDVNSNYKVRFAAADALGKIGDKNAFEALGTIAADEDEKSAYVKESAVVALGNLGDNRAIDVFSSIMSSKQMFLDKFSYLKERIIEAISKLDVAKDTRAIEILKKSLLEPSSRVRISAIEAIMNLESPESYSLIYDRLKYDDDFEVQKNALIALYNLSDRKILDEVANGEYSQELKMEAQTLIDEYEDEDE